MIIGRSLILNNTIKLHELGVVEEVTFEKLSNQTYYQDIAEAPAKFQKRHFKHKSLTFNLRVKEKDREKTKDMIDKIVGLSFSDEPISLLLDDKKWTMAILETAEDELFFENGLLVLEFTNIYGVWYGLEKTASLGTSFNVLGVINTDYGVLEITNSANTSKIQLGSTYLEPSTTLLTSPIIINLKNKTVKQLDAHVPISLNSDFFELSLGSNNITTTNASGTITYREVVAL